MIKHQWIGVLTALLMAAAVFAIGFAYMNPSAFANVTKTTEPAYASEMDKTRIMDIQLIVDEAQWADLLKNATAEEYIPATVIINGQKLTHVGVRPKGNSSLSTVARDSTTDRYSFKFEFDQYITGQTWLGLDKLAVNNMMGDASYMKEYLSYDLMRYIGVEAPLYAFADITVNGESWGFYLAVECLEDSYATRVYGSDHGRLYKPESMGMRGEGRMNEFIEAMQNDGANGGAEEMEGEALAQMPPFGKTQRQAASQSNLSPNSQNRENRGGGGMGNTGSSGVTLQYTDNELSSYSAIFENAVFDATASDYEAVVNALEKLSKGEDLAGVVDVEAVLKYFAAHTVVVNLDSYVSNMAHNYYLYERKGQLTILPWDYNLAFGGFQSRNAASVVNFPIDTPVSGVTLAERPLLGKLLEVPEYQSLYHSYLAQIVTGYFDSGLFEQTVDYLNALIAPHVENDPTAFYHYEAYQTAVTELKKLGLLRAESIHGQLNGTVPATTAEQNANPSRLIDASSVNLSALGSQGGGGGGGMPGGADREQGGIGSNMGRVQSGRSDMPMTDRQTLPQIMEIIQAANGNALTEEQRAQLRGLGLTDEQIAQYQNMPQGGFNGIGMGNTDGRRQNNLADNFERSVRQAPGIALPQAPRTLNDDPSTWLTLGASILIFSTGLWFVIKFKRRNV